MVASQQYADDNVGASDNTAGNPLYKDTQFGHPTNYFHPLPPWYSYLPSQPPFSGAPQFFPQAPFNMTSNSQPSSSVTQGYPSYSPSWQAYDFPHGGYISTMYFRLRKTPGVSERMWSVNLEASISGEYHTVGGLSGWPSE
jgi:hypothetical protein